MYASTNKAYTVKSKATGLCFGGFNSDNSIQWVGEEKARLMSEEAASEQAYLLTHYGKTDSAHHPANCNHGH